MKNLPVSLALLLGLAGAAAADVPKKPTLNSYNKLWTDSPFTSKPPPPEAGPVANPLDDYALIGVSPIGGNDYRVTLINKKKPDERIMVDSGPGREGFRVLGVIRKPGNPLGTIVQMASGALTGTVAFDEKLLALVAPPAAKPQQVPGQPPIPGQLMPPGQPQPRAVRPRVVPPPTPQGVQQPQVQQQQIQQQQLQQQQQIQQQQLQQQQQQAVQQQQQQQQQQQSQQHRGDRRERRRN